MPKAAIVVLPLTYPDLRWVADMDPFAAETESDLETLEQDVYHLLVQDLGSNLDAPDLGIGVDGYLSGTANALAVLPGVIDRQLAKDDRIDASTTTITPATEDTNTLIEILLQVGGQVIPINFQWDSTAGLQPYPAGDS